MAANRSLFSNLDEAKETEAIAPSFHELAYRQWPAWDAPDVIEGVIDEPSAFY
jgi:hypothetical protein